MTEKGAGGFFGASAGAWSEHEQVFLAMETIPAERYEVSEAMSSCLSQRKFIKTLILARPMN